jgi:hypothetical protein
MIHSSSLAELAYVVSGPDDLDRLRRRRAVPPKTPIRIALPGLAEHRRVDFERRLARHASACGCNEGTVTTLLYVMFVVLLLVAGWLAPRSFSAWSAIVGGMFVSLVLGKIFGLVVARQRFLRVLNDLDRAFSSQAKKD